MRQVGRVRRVGGLGRAGTSWEGWEDWDGWEGWDEWDGWDRWDGCNGRVLIKILAIEKKILPLLKVKNIVLIRDAIIEYGDCRVGMSP